MTAEVRRGSIDPMEDAIAEHVRHLLTAEAARLEFDCGEALELTAPGRRHQLIIVEQVGVEIGTRHRAVACLL